VLYLGLLLILLGSLVLAWDLNDAQIAAKKVSERYRPGPDEFENPSTTLRERLANAHMLAGFAAVLGGCILVALRYMTYRDDEAHRLVERRLSTEVMRYAADGERARVLTSVNHLIEVLGETHDLDAVLSEAVNAIREILNVENLVLELYGTEESLYRRHIVKGDVEDIDLGDELFEDVIGRGRSRLINRLDALSGYERLVEDGFRSLLVTPLTSNRPGGTKEPVGYLAALCKVQRDFTTHELSLLHHFAQQASLIIENAQLYQKTHNMAMHDGLTNLYNHRRFREVLDTMIADAKATKSSLGLLMGDIDHFKNYNDTHGHLQGDMVLRTVGDIMRSSVRGADTVARYGGEEFVVLLPHTDMDGCRLVGETLRTRIANHRFEGEEKQPGGLLTITFGLALFPNDAQDAVGLIEAADAALYAGKHAGRNMLVVAVEAERLEEKTAAAEKAGLVKKGSERHQRR
jgi:diguanylate cyclase (GGDEF)-like protein